MRATICVDRGAEAEVQAVAAWFATWAAAITSCSENQGCGCCVDLWEVEASPEAVAALPDAVRGTNDGGAAAGR